MMANLTPSQQKPVTYGFLMLDSFSMISFSGAIEILRLANYITRNALFDWVTVTLNGDAVKASNGISAAPDSSMAELDPVAVLFVCGGVNPGKQWSPELAKALQLIDKRGGALGALCTGAYQLAKSNLLNGLRCTLHWENIASTREEFPKVIVTNDIYEIDKGRYTCAGGTTSIDLMLELVGRSHGRELAAAISEEAVIDRIRTKDDQQRVPLRQQIGTSQPKLTEAVKLMEANLEELISPDELAGYVGISRRQLERLFRTYLHCTPSRYYLKLRLRNARMLLLQTENSIVEISLVCGFVSTPHFSKCYREMFGLPPRDERRRLLVGASLLPADSAGN